MTEHITANGLAAGRWFEDITDDGRIIIVVPQEVQPINRDTLQGSRYQEVAYSLQTVQLPGWKIRLRVWWTGALPEGVPADASLPGWCPNAPSTPVAYGAKWWRNILAGRWDLAYPDPEHARGYNPDRTLGAVSMELLYELRSLDRLQHGFVRYGWPNLPREAFGVDTRRPVAQRALTPEEVMDILMGGNTSPNPSGGVTP